MSFAALFIPTEPPAPCELIDLRDLSSSWATTLGCHYVDVFPCRLFDSQMIVDDNGILRGRPFNRRASLVAQGRYIAGPALLVGLSPWGETEDVPSSVRLPLLCARTDGELVDQLYGRTSR